MAKKSVRRPASSLCGFKTEPLLLQHLQASSLPAESVDRAATGRKAIVHVLASRDKKAPSTKRSIDNESGIEMFLAPLMNAEIETDPALITSPSVRIRDAVGAALGAIEKSDVQSVEFDFQLENELLEAAILGLELALYRFKRVFKGELATVRILVKNKNRIVPEKLLRQAALPGVSVNLARHLTNLPPNLLNPVSYAEAMVTAFRAIPHVKVEVWDERQLLKEKMHLLLAVGVGSATPPRLVHIRYRPPGAAKAPIALVGKGVTFDSGGLDIKPASGMRLMKKDMGGSAAVAGVALWAAQSQLKVALDIYMPLAENAIGGRAFRPSDVIVARSGVSVEIHNTDAEGRLVLADALDVAITQKEKPRHVIDVATLTGAIKVALGSTLAGLFANDRALAQALAGAGQKSGDLTWTMPLYQKYRGQLSSTFADVINSPDGFGGAVTAALFLEKFVGEFSWAHLDIYAWKDSADGAWLEAGGSGQSVLGLSRWLSSLK